MRPVNPNSPMVLDSSRPRAESSEEPVAPDELDADEIEFAEVVDDDLDEAPLSLTDADFEEILGPIDATAEGESAASATVTAPEPEPPAPPPPPRQLVLLGAGLAHLQVLNWWRPTPIPGVELTLVTAFDQVAYANMLPGTLSGMYKPEEMLIDIPRLCQRCGVRLIVDRANRLDPVERQIEFAHQPALSFDVASINMGSVPASEPLWQSHRILISVKPLSTFLQRFAVRFHELVEQWRAAPGEELLQIVVVGAGATGVELALCLEQHKHELELPADVRLVDGRASILPELSPRAVRRAHHLLKHRGIDLSLGSPVVDCDDEGAGYLVLENGTRIRADLVIWAAGAAPPMALRGFELPKDAQGFLTTHPTLQSTADVPVFVAGDAGVIAGMPLPKAGFHAARQARILWRNLKCLFAGQALKPYRPPAYALRILACGDGTALLDYKGLTSHSHWAWQLKTMSDRRWMRQFR